MGDRRVEAEPPAPDRTHAARSAPTGSARSSSVGVTDRALLRLQRSAGNAAVGSLFGPVVQRGVLGQLEYAFRGDEELTKRADTGDCDAIKALSDYGKLDDARRMKYVDTILGQSDLGWRDKRALFHLWGAYGDGVLTPARAHPDAWARSVGANADVGTIGPLASAKGQFTVEVRNLARGILNSNQAEVERQFDRLGADADGNVKKGLSDKDQARLAAQQRAAAQIASAQDYQRSLENTVIGYDIGGPQATATGPRVPITLRDAVGSQGKVTDTAPFIPPPEGAPSFQQVKQAYELASAVIRGQMTKWPALYSVVGGTIKPFSAATPELMAVAAGKPDEARTQLLTSLKATKANITKGQSEIGDPDLPLDLTTLHRRLMAGAGALPWGDPVYRPVVDAFVKGHNEQKAMEALGLTVLAALAFILAEFATGGMATFLVVAGVTASVGAAVDKIQDARTATALEGSAISDETRLIEEGKADEAVVDAALQTVFTVVDVALAAKTILGAGKAAAGLAELDKLAPAEKAARVEASVEEIGAAATVRASGQSVESLLAMVPAESRAAQSLKLVRGEIAVGTGIASAAGLKSAVEAGEALSKEWVELGSVEARAGRLEKMANEALPPGISTPIKVVIRPEAGFGAWKFNPTRFEITIPSGWLGARSETLMPTIVAKIHHETRHAEQYWLVARRLTAKNVSRADIIARTGLEGNVVDQAMLRPLLDGEAEAAAADKWITSIGDVGGQAKRTKVYQNLDRADANLAKAKEELTAVEKSGNPEAIRTARNNFEDEREVFDECYRAYRSLPEEVDAWGVEEAIESTLRMRAYAKGIAIGVGVGAGAGAAAGGVTYSLIDNK